MFAYATHFRSKIGHISVCYYTSKLFTSWEKQIESNLVQICPYIYVPCCALNPNLILIFSIFLSLKLFSKFSFDFFYKVQLLTLFLKVLFFLKCQDFIEASPLKVKCTHACGSQNKITCHGIINKVENIVTSKVPFMKKILS